MRHIRDSILKRLHTLQISPQKCRKFWATPYWQDQGDRRNIACNQCRKFNSKMEECSVGFGTPLRKCVVASIEAHFNDCTGLECLEIGFGRFKLAKQLILRSGGKWTGVDPKQPAHRKARKGKGGYGTASDTGFPDESFDLVFGIQTFEHWGQKSADREPSDYADCLREIWRVLKPGGTLYLDAPMYFHGHEMFIMADVPRIQSLFKPGSWKNLVIEQWRKDHSPLPRYAPNQTVLREWPIEINSYSKTMVESARQSASVWLLTVSATKAQLQN